MSRLRAVFTELRRRRVYRIGAVYLAAAFVGVQALDLVRGGLVLPDWLYPAAVLLAILGFPVAVVLAWVFDITPHGIRRTPEVAAEGTAGPPSGVGLATRIGLALAVIALTAAGGRWVWTTQVTAPPDIAPRPAAVPGAIPDLNPLRLAVLYLDDHSPGGELGYLADGLTQELLHELGRVEVLEVVSRNAVRAARDGVITVDSLVRALGIGTYVEGAVARSGDRVRVTVQLVDASSGARLSTVSFDRPLGELFALRDTLATEIGDALRRRLGVELRMRTARTATPSVEAWTLVQRAERLVDDVRRTWAREPAAVMPLLDRAEELLAQAERLDPSWLEPILRRGWLAHRRAHYLAEIPGSAVETPLREALALAARALERAPGDPAALELRGKASYDLANALAGDGERDALLEGAAADLRAALDLAPGLARAWWTLAELARQRGDRVESIAFAERALREDYFLEEAFSVLFHLYRAAFELEDAALTRRWCAEGRRRYPDLPDFILCELVVLASIASVPPDTALARSLADSVVLLAAEPDRPAWRSYTDLQLAKVFARSGQRDSAEVLLERAHGDRFQVWLAYDEAHARLLLGQPDRALELLERYLEFRPGRREYWPHDWWLRDLWTDPEFQRLVAEPPG